MKRDWEIKQLGDVCEFHNGFAFKSKTFKNAGEPVLRISNIQNDEIDLNNLVFIDPSDYKENLSKYKVLKGDLLIAMSGATTGKLGINQTDYTFYLNQRVGKFEPKKELNKSYLYYFLSTKVEESLKISAGSAQPNLSTQQIKSFQLPFPPLPEQERIVAKLDQCFEAVDEAKANVEQNLHNAKELFQSQLNQIFSQKGEDWEEKKLGEVAELKGRIGWKGLTAKEYTKEGPLFLSVYSLNYGDYVDFKDAFHISQERYQESPEIMLQEGDVLICKDGAGIGKVGMVGELPDEATVNSSLLVIRGHTCIKTKYLYFSLLSTYFQRIVQNRLQGATTPHLYQRDIKTFPIFLPQIKEQDRIIDKINFLNTNCQKLIFGYQQELDALDELKKSILQKAFNGEI